MPRTDLLPPPTRARRKSRRKLGLVLAGVALVVVGVVGGILPIVPGTPLVLLGVGMMATHSPRGRWLRWRVGGYLRARGLDGVIRRVRAIARSGSRSRGSADRRAPGSGTPVAPSSRSCR